MSKSRPRRGYADGPFGQVHFQDTGGDGPPLILCHQAPLTSRQYDTVYPVFAKAGVRAIGIDTPGFGMSDPTDFVPTVEDYAKVVPAVMDHLGIAQADLLGHHTGALIVTEASLQFPDRVRNLIMAGPVPLTDEERAAFMNDIVEKVEKKFVHKKDGTHLSELYVNRIMWLPDGFDTAMVTRYVVEQLQGFAPFWYGHHAAFLYDHNAAIPKVTHRTLILTNTDDIIFPQAQQTKEMRPDFEMTVLENGAIDPTDLIPEAWVNAVVTFLKGESP